MSMTFQVLPSNKNIPHYKEILELANLFVNNYLLKIGVNKNIALDVNVYNIKTSKSKIFTIEDAVVTDEESYAWFSVNNISGGTDCYFLKNNPIYAEIWEDDLHTNTKAQENKIIIRKNIDIGYRWLFRRSAGQPAIITLSYGMLAASLAKLTDGVIFSDDGAWDYTMLPAKSENFVEWYLSPELTENKDCKKIAQDCIGYLQNNKYN